MDCVYVVSEKGVLREDALTIFPVKGSLKGKLENWEMVRAVNGNKNNGEGAT